MPTALTWCCRAEGKRVFQFCKKCCRRTAKAGRNCNSYCNGCGGYGPSPPAWTGVVCESAPHSGLHLPCVTTGFFILKDTSNFIYWGNSYNHNMSFLGPFMDLHTFSCPTIDSLTSRCLICGCHWAWKAWLFFKKSSEFQRHQLGGHILIVANGWVAGDADKSIQASAVGLHSRDVSEVEVHALWAYPLSCNSR